MTLISTFNLAGFFASHAIWCVSDGEDLIPILAYITSDNQRKMDRIIINDDLESSVVYGKERLRSNDANANNAVFLYDGRITVSHKTIDAIILEMRAYSSSFSEAVLALPYTPKSTGTFKVHKPKLLMWKNCDDFELENAFQSFFEGAYEHEKGSKIWNECLDESI